MDALLALPYLIVRGIAIVASRVGAHDWVRIKPRYDANAGALPLWLRALTVGFAGVALFIALPL